MAFGSPTIWAIILLGIGGGLAILLHHLLVTRRLSALRAEMEMQAMEPPEAT